MDSLPNASDQPVLLSHVELPPAPVTPKQKDWWMTSLIIILALCALGVVGVLVLVVFHKNVSFLSQKAAITPTPKQLTSMSGSILFEGYFPPNAYVAISERSQKGESFRDVVSGIIPENGKATWTWDSAREGTNYEIRASLKIQGKVIQSSDLADISAPSQNVLLTIVSEQQPSVPATTAIGGTIHVDGYIPLGATMSIFARQEGTSASVPIATGIIPGNTDVPWTWASAAVGKTYIISAQLLDTSGNIISSPNQKTITAPASGIFFLLSSTAQPLQAIATGVSGTITINGAIPSNSYITIGMQPTNTTGFTQVGGNISSTNGVSWSWLGATSGNQYDMQAYLWANGKPYAQSNIVTVTAPSNNTVLTINAQQALAAPAQNTLSVSCAGQQNGLFQATVNYNTSGSINNAQSYNIVVLLASQGNQVINTTLTPNNPGNAQSFTTTYMFTPGATYYAQYAYAVSGTNFSPLSPSVQFSCK